MTDKIWAKQIFRVHFREEMGFKLTPKGIDSLSAQ